jgi:hypothetical protein
VTRAHRTLDFPGSQALIEAGRVPPPSPGAVDAARSLVLAAVERDIAAPSEPAASARAPRWGGSRRRLMLTASAAVLAAAAVAAVPVLGSHRTSPPPATAQAFLRNTARVAAAAPASDAPYWRRTTWSVVPADNDPPRTVTNYIDRADRIVLVDAHGKKTKVVGKLAGWWVGDARRTWAGLDKLPTDPKVLAELIGSNARSSTERQAVTVNTVTMLLGESPAGPELRAALYRVLATTPHVKLLGPATDTRGRKGTELQWDSGDDTTRLVIDPRTAELLEQTVTARTRLASICADPKIRPRCIPRKVGSLQARYTYLVNGPVMRID